MNTVVGLFDNYSDAKRAAVITAWLIDTTSITILPIAPDCDGSGSARGNLKGLLMLSGFSRDDITLNAQEAQQGGVLVFVVIDAHREEQTRDILRCNGVLRLNTCPPVQRDTVRTSRPSIGKYGEDLVDIYLSQASTGNCREKTMIKPLEVTY